MFISKEFKAAMNVFKEARRVQLESEKPMSIKKIQLLSIVNGCFGVFFFIGNIDVAAPINYFLSGGCLFVTFFFWGIAIWLHLAIPKGFGENWPPQFRTVGQIRRGFFELKNYPKLQKVCEESSKI